MNKASNSVNIMENLMDAIGEKIFQRIKSLSNEEEFMVVDRVTTTDFLKVFRENAEDYSSDVVLCERMYFKKACRLGERKVYEVDDDAVKLYKDYVELAETLSDIEVLKQKTQEEFEDSVNKLKEMKESLKSAADKTKESNIEVDIYETPFNKPGYLVTDVRKIPNESLRVIANSIAAFIISYFNCMHISPSQQYQISVFPVKAMDYVDIVAKISYVD